MESLFSRKRTGEVKRLRGLTSRRAGSASGCSRWRHGPVWGWGSCQGD